MRNPALCKCEPNEYLSENYVHIHGSQNIWAIHKPKSDNRAIHILSFFFKKRKVYHITGGAEKGGYSARPSALYHIQGVSYHLTNPPSKTILKTLSDKGCYFPSQMTVL